LPTHISLFVGIVSRGPHRIQTEGADVPWRLILGVYGCTVLILIFIAWCAIVGYSNGEEHGPKL